MANVRVNDGSRRHCRPYTDPAIIGESRSRAKTTRMPEVKPSLCFIGFGEAGQAMAAGLREAGIERIAAWDILFPQPEGERLRHAGRGDRRTMRCVCRRRSARCRLVISAVTAASSVDAVQSVRPHLAGKPFLLDINSVSPGRKQEAAKLLGDTARYVDVAVIAPIHPARHQTPMLIAGPHAEAAAPVTRRARHARHHCRSGSWRCSSDQDGAKRHDQGHRGADA